MARCRRDRRGRRAGRNRRRRRSDRSSRRRRRSPRPTRMARSISRSVRRLGYWAGWVIPAGARIVLLADDEARPPRRRVSCCASGSISVMGTSRAAPPRGERPGLPTSRIMRDGDAGELARAADSRAGVTVLDVRTPAEWQSGHIAGSINLPVGRLVERSPTCRGTSRSRPSARAAAGLACRQHPLR